MNSLAEELAEYLRYRKECGDKTVELEPGTLEALAALSGAPKAVVSPAPAATPAPTAVPPRPLPQPPPRPISPAVRQPPAASPPPPPSAAPLPKPGRTSTDLMVVGETEAIQAGKYGELLTKMIAAMGYSLDDIALTNICGKPRAEKPPTPDEMAAAMPDFKRRLAETAPKVLLVMGSTAALGILGTADLSSAHGRWFTFEGVPTLPTYHPAYLLKFPGAKKDAWSDLKKVMARLGRPVPTRP